MNNQEARQILRLFRPGTADEEDHSFREARQLAKADPELAQWFQLHCEAYLALRSRFQAIPIPAGLKEQIISERKIQRPFFKRYWRPLLAAAAAVVFLLGTYSGLWHSHRLPDPYDDYRANMTQLALLNYSMSLMTNDPIVIRSFLKNNGAPADYTLPDGLKKAEVAGCLVSRWQDSVVSMICFKTGRPLPAGQQSDLWFFVIDRQAFPNAPLPGRPVFGREKQATTASWSDDKKSYFLAAVGDEALLQKYIQ